MAISDENFNHVPPIISSILFLITLVCRQMPDNLKEFLTLIISVQRGEKASSGQHVHCKEEDPEG